MSFVPINSDASSTVCKLNVLHLRDKRRQLEIFVFPTRHHPMEENQGVQRSIIEVQDRYERRGIINLCSKYADDDSVEHLHTTWNRARQGDLCFSRSKRCAITYISFQSYLNHGPRRSRCKFHSDTHILFLEICEDE